MVPVLLGLPERRLKNISHGIGGVQPSATFVILAGVIMSIISLSLLDEKPAPLKIIILSASKRTPYSEEFKDARVCERAFANKVI